MQYASQVAPAARIARLSALLAVALVAVIAALAPSADAYSIKQWTFKYSGAPSTNAPFSLYNQDTQDEVRYGERSCGINLVWSPGTTREWRLRRANGSTGPLRFGERLALRNDTVAAYMNYRSRDCGINLDWSSTPKYEWVIRGGTTGAQVTSAANLALFNEREPDYLVHRWRAAGINLMWSEDSATDTPCKYLPIC